MILNNADRIYLGADTVDKVYLGSAQVWPLLPVNLYDQQDACSIGAAESESIGTEWSVSDENQVELLIETGNNSSWSMRVRKLDTSQNTPSGSYGGYATISLGGFEVGETYRLTADSRALNATEDGAGRAWFEVGRGTDSHTWFDIESFEWLSQSYEFVALEETMVFILYAAWSRSNTSTQGNSCLLDNIFIEKIS
ncbi:hypothetical protein [Gelidibacter sp.]|uniref:hypothetical protein n=1 Tax=Gelidibacter sp. TaxID=2018083 RepID=UPI002D1122BA|nr:hypothetical protein [Gelidibacter sp.]HUH27683.1 hypothetical protein [Gelidibacter sp.]